MKTYFPQKQFTENNYRPTIIVLLDKDNRRLNIASTAFL